MLGQMLINRHQKLTNTALHADFLLLCGSTDLPCNVNLVNGRVCITMLPPFEPRGRCCLLELWRNLNSAC
jgi:hypothetical protein